MAIPFRAWDGFLAERRAVSVRVDLTQERIIALDAGLFGKQLEVEADPAKFIACICTRRAGKTRRIGVRRLKCMELHPGINSWSGYITLTKGQSRRNLAGVLQELIREHSLPVTWTEVDGQITYQHENGHQLWLGGVDDLRKTERWRGNKWWEVEFDEGGAWPDEVLTYMVDDVVGPAMTDNDGVIILNGSPAVLAKGLFYEVTTPGLMNADGTEKRPQWPTYRWSVLDNPFHPFGHSYGREDYRRFRLAKGWPEDGRHLLEGFRLSKGWALDNPTYRREWLAEWASDPDLLIYRYDGRRNAFHELPDGTPPRDWRMVLGVDVGHNDDTAFVLTASRSGHPHVYVLRAWGAGGLTQPQRATELLRTQDALKRAGYREASVVVDTGGLGKALAFDLTKTYGVNCKPAEKQHKAAAIRAVQGALESGNMFVCPWAADPEKPLGLGAQQLISEWSVMPWNDDRTGHHDSYSDHCSDALLYAYREHPVWENWEEELPKLGTSERKDYDIERLIEREQEEGELRQLLRGASASDRLDIIDRLRESA